jgi:hypothetical protein
MGRRCRFGGVEVVREASWRSEPCGVMATTVGGSSFDFSRKTNEGGVGRWAWCSRQVLLQEKLKRRNKRVGPRDQMDRIQPLNRKIDF